MSLTFDEKKNFAFSVVAVAPSPAASGTSLQVAPGDGAKFPTPPFNAVVWPSSVQPTSTNAEVVRVTAIATDTLTITRAQESSSARTVIANDQIALNVTAKSLTDIEGSFVTAGQVTCPVGAIMMWASTSIPTGWLVLNGSEVSRTTYSELFALWGTTFGVGDGSTTFNLIDMREYIPIGLADSGTMTSIGLKAGSFDHTHGSGTLAVASHTHSSGTLTVASHNHDSGTLSVASHTHGPGTLTVASHTHGSGSFGTNTANLSHTHSIPSHTHGFSGTTSSASQTQATEGTDGGAVTPPTHTHTFSGTTDSGGSGTSGAMSANSTHSHSVTGTSSSTAPAVSSGLTASTAPSVNSGNTGSTAPAVSSGSTGSTSPAVSSGSTASANPPVIALNFIVRATSDI